MAQQQHGVVLDQEQFCCSICLDLLTEPVTLHCGHSYCRSCIEGCWDQQYEDRRVCSCPQCRETFIPRPVLRKNNILAGVVENLRQSSARPPEEKCSRHNEPIKVYCRTDQQCICFLCAMDDHKGHDTVSVLAERAVKEKQVMKSKQELQQKIQERKKELKDLNQSTETLKSSAVASVDATDKIFREMMASVERRRSEVKSLIRDQEKTAVAHAERLQRQMEEEIARLERRNADLEELSNTDDIHFIQSFRSLSMSTASPVLPSIALHPLTSFTDVSDAVSGLRDKLEDILKTTWPLMSDRGAGMCWAPNSAWEKELAAVGPAPQSVCFPGVLQRRQADTLKPQTRNDFLQYVCELTLDPNTAHRDLTLSDNNRKVTRGQPRSYPDHPDRFDYWIQVLCRENLNIRCYWEVECSERVFISVTHRGINRKTFGKDSGLGHNEKSWCLDCDNRNNSFSVHHNGKETKLSVCPSDSVHPVHRSNRVGVYVDRSARTLSFYRVSSDTLIHLHTSQSTFTEPLIAGFWLGAGSSVSLCQMYYF